MSDLKTLTLEDLEAHHVEVLAEIERRRRLASIPDQIRELSTAYRADGGDNDELLDAVTRQVEESGPAPE